MVVDRLTRAIIILAVSPSLLAHPVPRSTRSTVYHVFLFILFYFVGGFLIRVPLTSGGFYIRLDSSSFHATTSLFVLFFLVCLFCFCSFGSREPYLHFLALPVTKEAQSRLFFRVHPVACFSLDILAG